MAIDIDINKIATDLNGKADVDLTNVVGAMSESAKNYFSGAGMPSTSQISLTIGASGATYTAPANGYFYIRGTSTNDTNYHHITAFYNSTNNWTTPTQRISNNAPSAGLALFIPVKNSQTIRVEYDKVSGVTFAFVYTQGEQ